MWIQKHIGMNNVKYENSKIYSAYLLRAAFIVLTTQYLEHLLRST